MSCVVKGMGTSWREQPRAPRYKKDQTRLDIAISNSEAFCLVNCCKDEQGHAVFAQDYMASQIYIVAVRITKYTSASSGPVVLKIILKYTKLSSCLKCSLIIAKLKILFLDFICVSYNSGEVYNIVLLINNCDLFILLEIFLANERHLLLPVSSPMQTRLFWWDSVQFMLLRNELVGTDKRNETENYLFFRDTFRIAFLLQDPIKIRYYFFPHPPLLSPFCFFITFFLLKWQL